MSPNLAWLPPWGNRMEYDERRELTIYVIDYFWSHLFDSERRQIGYRGMRTKVEATLPERAWADAMNYFVPSGQPPAPSECYAVFLDNVVDRVLSALPPGVSVNRCPTCARVLRSPQAKLCVWCGHSRYEHPSQHADEPEDPSA